MTKTMTDEEADKLLKKKIELVGELTELYEEFFGKELREYQIHKLMNTDDNELKRLIALFKRNMKQTEPEEEIWKPCTKLGFSNYAVSNKGKLMNLKTKKLLANTINKSCGYITNQLSQNGKRLSIQRGRLVLLVFEPIENDKYYDCDHISGSKLDNSLENLQWLSHKDNCIKINRTSEHKKSTKRGYFLVYKNADDVKIKYYKTMKEAAIKENIQYNTLRKLNQYNRFSKKHKCFIYKYEELPYELCNSCCLQNVSY